MAGKRGNSVVAVYSGIAPEFEEEYNNWHNTHHIPPRMKVPGFLAAARYPARG